MPPAENEEIETSVRLASGEDFDWLYELHVDSMREYVELVYGWDDEHQRQLFFYDFRPKRMNIILSAGEPVGMFELDLDHEGHHLRRLEISSDCQGKGIGGIIVRKLITAAADDRQRLWLTVLKANPRAKRFYEGLGFQEIEELSFHFKMVHLGC